MRTKLCGNIACTAGFSSCPGDTTGAQPVKCKPRGSVQDEHGRPAKGISRDTLRMSLPIDDAGWCLDCGVLRAESEEWPTHVAQVSRMG